MSLPKAGCVAWVHRPWRQGPTLFGTKSTWPCGRGGVRLLTAFATRTWATSPNACSSLARSHTAVYSLLHFPSRHRASPLASMLPVGARTFLPRAPRGTTPATARISPTRVDYSRASRRRLRRSATDILPCCRPRELRGSADAEPRPTFPPGSTTTPQPSTRPAVPPRKTKPRIPAKRIRPSDRTPA